MYCFGHWLSRSIAVIVLSRTEVSPFDTRFKTSSSLVTRKAEHRSLVIRCNTILLLCSTRRAHGAVTLFGLQFHEITLRDGTN